MLIASCSLKLEQRDRVAEVAIRLFAPVQGGNGSWSCRYEVDWPEGKWSMEAAGVDAVQALLVALQMIGSELYTSNYHKAGQLCFDAPGRGYGFPVPSSLRDLLVGDDKKHL